MEEDAIQAAVALAAVVTLPAGILTWLFVGWQMSAAVFVVGWLLLVSGFVVGDAVSSDDSDATTDSIEEAKRPSAHGEIDEAELERRTGVLLETETEGESDDARTRERDPDPEFEFE